MQLAQALRLGKTPRLALVGAGGKTTALFHLARELLEDPAISTVIATTSTHLAVAQCALADRHFIVQDPMQVERLMDRLPDGMVLLTGPQGEDERVVSPAPTILARIHALAQGYECPLLVEADGSRRSPLKAPAAHEPAIPDWVDRVVVVAGLSGLGKPLAEPWVHRSELFSQLAGIPEGAPIDPNALVRFLVSKEGGQKDIPPHARSCLLLNQADTPIQQAQAYRMARDLKSIYDSVTIASLLPHPAQLKQPRIWAVHQRVAGIILAAGASRRLQEQLQQPKQLLDWRGQPFVRRVAAAALAADLSPVILVLGYQADSIRTAIQDLPLQIVHNPDWEHGQSASLIAGLHVLPTGIGGAIFLLADQPQIPANLLNSLLSEHAVSLAPIIAPLADGKRSNPVLFDRQVFPDLLSLRGDTGGRALFSRYPIHWLPWHDPNIGLDVDTLEDYNRLIIDG